MSDDLVKQKQKALLQSVTYQGQIEKGNTGGT